MKSIELRPLSRFRVFSRRECVTAVEWSPGGDAVFASMAETRGMLRARGLEPRELALSGFPDSLLEPVNSRLVVLADHCGAAVVDFETARTVSLEGFAGNVRISDDGATALGRSRDGQLMLRGTRDGALLQTFECPDVVDYALSGDGSTVTALSRGCLWTWRAPFRDAPSRLERPELVETYRIALSADGTRAASVHRQQFVQLWDLQAGAELACVFRFRDWTCDQLVLDPTGTFALLVDARGATVFNFERKEKSEPLELSQSRGCLVSRTGHCLWVGTPGRNVEAYQVSEQSRLVRAPELDDAPMGLIHFLNAPFFGLVRVDVSSGAVKWSTDLRAPLAHDGRALYAAGAEGMHRVDDDGNSVSVVDGFPVVRAAGQGGRIAAAGAQGPLAVGAGQAASHSRRVPQPFMYVEAIALSPDGALLAVAAPQKVYLFDASTLEPRRTFPKEDVASALWFSADALCVAYDSAEENDSGYIERFPLTGGLQTRVETGQGLFLAVSRDGTLLLMRSWWSQLQLFEVSTGKLLYEQPYVPNTPQAPASGAFSSDGRRLAIGTAHGELLLYELVRRAE